MLDTGSADQLAAIIDQFSVPMFAAERASAQSEFKITCINRSHAEATGCTPEAMRDVALHDLLPPGEADIVSRRYAECADTRRDLRYQETLTLPHGVQHWDTSLQHIPLASGGDRVVGVAIKLASEGPVDGAHLTFDNIRFFSSLADMQLQNLLSMFEAARDQGLFSTDSASRVSRLCGICRSVQRSVEDIRETVRRAHPQAVRKEHHMPDLGGSTLRAIYDTTEETR